MLDLNTIFGMREQMLPQDGLLGFLLQNWLKIAIVVMILGFLIDQVLYIVRYRPQDRFLQLCRKIKNLFQRMKDKETVSETEKELSAVALKAEPVQMPIYRAQKKPAIEDTPIIRRGGAKYAPAMQQPAPEQMREMPDVYEDEDAPLIVRASSGPVRRNMDEPDTHRIEKS